MAFMIPEYWHRRSGFFARLSAPGYLDCTEWSGPFETYEEAQQWVEEFYQVDPETGEELSDDT